MKNIILDINRIFRLNEWVKIELRKAVEPQPTTKVIWLSNFNFRRRRCNGRQMGCTSSARDKIIVCFFFTVKTEPSERIEYRRIERNPLIE